MQVYLKPRWRNSLMKCAPQPKIEQNPKIAYFESLRSFKVIDVDTIKSQSPLLVMICSMYVFVCNCFRAKRAKSGKMATLGGSRL